MTVTREVETKLTMPDGVELPALGAVKGVASLAVRTFRLRATYYDTADLRLARSQVTLRHRTGEGRPRWTLKLPPSTGPGRDEHTLTGPGTTIPPVLVELLTARLRGAALGRVVQLKTLRHSTLLFDADGHELTEVVDDLVTSSGGGGWREVEVELREGGEKVAARVLDLLRGAGAEVGDQTPKAVRALGPAAATAPDLPGPRQVGRKDPAGDLVRWALLTAQLDLVAHDTAVRLATVDAVHQLRVSCRRLRSDLRTFRTLLDDPRAEQLRTELAWLADGFGAARDLEVLRARIQCTAALSPRLDASAVDALLADREQAALLRAQEVLGSGRYVQLLALLHQLCTEVRLSPLAQEPCGQLLPELVARTDRRLRRATGLLGLDDPDADWHRARILAKRARYAAARSSSLSCRSLPRRPAALHGSRRGGLQARPRPDARDARGSW